MPENYPEQLAERLRAQISPGRSLNKAAFLAVKADVTSALEAGFIPKDIWWDLRTCERINFSYDTFLRLVKLFIPSSRAAQLPPAVPPTKTAIKGRPSSPPAALNRPAGSTSGLPGFVINPFLKKEDLI